VALVRGEDALARRDDGPGHPLELVLSCHHQLLPLCKKYSIRAAKGLGSQPQRGSAAAAAPLVYAAAVCAGAPGNGVRNKGYDARGLAHEPTEISVRSDYAAFFDAGIPFGGLFTGAEGIKTQTQEDVYGGTAGQQYDPCYHAACDTFANVAPDVLDLNSDAVAFSTLTFAMSTRSVNGEGAAKGN
jgi:hypothetical protein